MDSQFTEEQVGELLEPLDIWFEYGGKLCFDKVQEYLDLLYRALSQKEFDYSVANRIREIAISVAYICPSILPNYPYAIKQLLLIAISSLNYQFILKRQTANSVDLDEKLVDDQISEGLGYINRVLKIF